MLAELGLLKQRYRAVVEVLNDGATVTDVCRRCGVPRQTVHRSRNTANCRRPSATFVSRRRISPSYQPTATA
jgi:transposase-like protein